MPMVFSINKVVLQIAKDFSVPKEVVEELINGEIGTRWILERHLNCSEVELSMALKTIRKRLSFDFSYTFTPDLDKKQRKVLFEKLLGRYRDFSNLHLRFLRGQNCYPEIYRMLLPDVIILDAGIDRKRFFQLLPQVLRGISPYELSLYFAVNTLLRWYIAVFLQSQVEADLYARGSLVFLSSRSFGCGYLANFPQEVVTNRDVSTYFPLQGSDLDLRIEKTYASIDINNKLEKWIDKIRCQLASYRTFLTIELTTFTKDSKDDLWPVKDFLTFKECLSKFLFKKSRSKKEKIRLKKSKVSISELKEKEFLRSNDPSPVKAREKVRLTENNIMKLRIAFQKVLQYHKVNEDFINLYLSKWQSLLEKAKRETDFYGFIMREDIFSVFKHLFFLSGCRFSEEEEQSLFKEVLDAYEKTKV